MLFLFPKQTILDWLAGFVCSLRQLRISSEISLLPTLPLSSVTAFLNKRMKNKDQVVTTAVTSQAELNSSALGRVTIVTHWIDIHVKTHSPLVAFSLFLSKTEIFKRPFTPGFNSSVLWSFFHFSNAYFSRISIYKCIFRYGAKGIVWTGLFLFENEAVLV